MAGDGDGGVGGGGVGGVGGGAVFSSGASACSLDLKATVTRVSLGSGVTIRLQRKFKQ